MQASLGDILGLVPDNHNKDNMAIKQLIANVLIS